MIILSKMHFILMECIYFLGSVKLLCRYIAIPNWSLMNVMSARNLVEFRIVVTHNGNECLNSY